METSAKTSMNVNEIFMAIGELVGERENYNCFLEIHVIRSILTQALSDFHINYLSFCGMEVSLGSFSSFMMLR